MKEVGIGLDMSQLFDLVPSVISIQNRDYRIVRVNETFRRLFGDCVGLRCFEAYKGRTEVCLGCPMARTFTDGTVHESEEVVRTRNDEVLHVAVQTAPIPGRDGGIAGGMEVMTDISRTIAEQQELVLLGRAMAGMAHDIKNILTGLEGGVFVVDEAMATGDSHLLKEGWEMVRRNTARVARLSRDQLFCSREREPEAAQIDARSVVCEAIELYRARAANEGTEILVELDPRVREGWLDADGIHRLMINLIANALDACRFDTEKEHHWISVKALLEAGGQLHLEVADNGPGIPERLCGSVFEEMFTTKGSNGTGLGLLVVYRVVCAHRGQITVLSEEGAGTVFTIILPFSSGARDAAGFATGTRVEHGPLR